MDRTIVILVAGVLTLNFVVVPLLGMRLASRRRAVAGLGRRVWRDVDGYASILLSRLMVQTCRILGLDKACLLVSDAREPRRLTAVVGHGIDEDVIGSRVPVDGPVLEALQTGRPQQIDANMLLPGPGAVMTAAAASTSREVVLCAATEPRRLELEEREIALLHELANLCASAIDDLAVKNLLDAKLRARAEQLTADRERERGAVASPRLDLAALAVQIGTRLRLERGALIELGLAARVIENESVEIPERRAAAARLASAPGLEVVTLIVRFVRERWDGRGLLELPGEQIPLASRILAACDAARVLTSDRPGAPGDTLETAVRRIQAGSGSLFDPTVVTALTHELIGDMPELGEDVTPAADWARADSQYDWLR